MIEIKRNPNGDSRTGNKNVSLDEFHKANVMHIADVYNIVDFLINILRNKARWHDYSKLEHEKLFYKNYLEAVNKEIPFEESEFYKLHLEVERHHPNKNLKDDVNLLDIIEMICDCIAAQAARNGSKPNDIPLDEGILELAYKNTIKYINDNITIKD